MKVYIGKDLWVDLTQVMFQKVLSSDEMHHETLAGIGFLYGEEDCPTKSMRLYIPISSK